MAICGYISLKMTAWQKWHFAFHLPARGKRLMTEALVRAVTFCFEETELQRLWADVHIQNIASYKTLEKQASSVRDLSVKVKW